MSLAIRCAISRLLTLEAWTSEQWGQTADYVHTPPVVCCVASPRLTSVFMQSGSPLNAAKSAQGARVRERGPAPRLCDPDKRTAFRRLVPRQCKPQHRQHSRHVTQLTSIRAADRHQNIDFAQVASNSLRRLDCLIFFNCRAVGYVSLFSLQPATDDVLAMFGPSQQQS